MSDQTQYRKGERIGDRYLVAQTHRGGMGEVYLCLDLETNQPYALKTFQRRYEISASLAAAFREEVAHWIGLEQHPNIVRCFFMKIVDTQPFMFLEWIASDEGFGADLRSRLYQGPLSLRLALELTSDICRGLIHAGQKRQGIVHRDLKPENILLSHGSVAKITDFGLARIAEVAQTPQGPTQAPAENAYTSLLSVEAAVDGRQSLQGWNKIVGTPAYMAPEQWRGEQALDVRTDIYAVGCMLYEMLSGKRPFQTTVIEEYRYHHEVSPVPALPSTIPLAAELDRMVARCLSKRRDERFATATALLEEIVMLYQQLFSTTPRAIPANGSLTVADYYNRGLTYHTLERYPDAVREYTQGITLDQTDVETITHRAIAYHKLGRYEQALADYNHALRLDPQNLRAQLDRSTMFADMQDYSQALMGYEQTLQLDPTLPSVYFNRGNTYYGLRQYDQALENYTQAIQLNPDVALAYNNRGNTYANLRRFQEAVEDYTRVIQLEPDHLSTYFNRALAYVELGREDKALQDFKFIVQHNPQDVEAHINAGALLAKAAHLREALLYFKAAARLGDQASNTYIAHIEQLLDQQDEPGPGGAAA